MQNTPLQTKRPIPSGHYPAENSSQSSISEFTASPSAIPPPLRIRIQNRADGTENYDSGCLPSFNFVDPMLIGLRDPSSDNHRADDSALDLESQNTDTSSGPTGVYYGNASKAARQLGLGIAAIDGGHPQPLSRPSSRASRPRRPLSALSFTPGEMLHPAPTYHSGDPQGLRTLGLTSPDSQSTTTDRELPAFRSDGHLVVTPQSLPSRSGPIGPPDGGYLAWAHAWAGFFVIFNCWGLNLSFGVFEVYYAEDMLNGVTPSQIAWIGSMQLFLVFFLATPIGRLYDAGYFRIFFNLGSALLVVFVFATSFCKTWWQLFLVQGVLTGTAMGMVFCSGVVVLMGYFSRNIGLAMGIGAAGSSIGGIVYTLMAQRLLPRVGFAWTIRNMGFMVLITMVAPNAIFRPRRRVVSARPWNRELLDWAVFKDTSFMLMTVGMFLAFWGLYFGFYYIIAYAVTILDLSAASSCNLLIAMLATNLPGRFIPALLSDRCIGPLNTLIPSTLLSSMLIFLWIGTSTRSALYVVACFYGFAAAGIQSLFPATVHAFNVGHEETMGVRSGVVFSVIGLACLTGTPIAGRLIGIRPGDNPFLYAQIWAGSSLLVGAVCFLGSRWVKVGWRAQRA